MDRQRRTLFRPNSARLWVDLGAVVVAFILYSISWPTLHVTHAVPVALQPFIAALAAFPVVLVRVNPALGWAISAGSALLIALAIPHQPHSAIPFQVVHILSLIVLLFAVALRAAPQIVVVAWVATSLLLATAMGDGVSTAWGWPIGMAAVVLVALLIRWLVSSRAQLLRQEEQNELERARRAILEEKARIARDLHDVVAHHMSLVVVQAQTAPYRVEDVSPAARAEFDSIGATAREALNEIRGMLGVLRSDGQLPEHAPQPKAADVLALFEGARRAGVGIEWTVSGDLGAVPETTGLALYRIVQESLSNASRHAPGAPVRVVLECGIDLRVRITNAAADTPARAVGNGGHGVAGMQARALAVGGELTAAARPDGGFEVDARLPLSADPAASALDPAAARSAG
ncbi:sensor histidine kinase [Nocardia bovistercoris]|uniref:histidine kinase n=1 Tax=Nocardia bovistercoris TaxID=2785916 RepID=A0A931IJY2_9NOCA|nr:histidine kinase [Nocardia bovistercoris]MBH0781382.1 sensor histidine kinase [Nocardia bovistercoris]